MSAKTSSGASVFASWFPARRFLAVGDIVSGSLSDIISPAETQKEDRATHVEQFGEIRKIGPTVGVNQVCLNYATKTRLKCTEARNNDHNPGKR